MIQNIFEVLTPRETEIFLLRNRDKLTVKQTAEKAKCSVNTVKEYTKRIKNKIKKLEDSNIDVEYGQVDEIEEIFNEDSTRMASKKTVTQVQFLAQCAQMSCKGIKQPASPAERKMRSRTGLTKKVTSRKMTEEERQKCKVIPMPRPERHVTKAYLQYYMDFEATEDIERMAGIEIILRAAGVIYRTPYINKLNRKTGMQMRAQECGFEIVMVEPGEGRNVPHGSKFVETVKNDEGNAEYSTWLFPAQFVCKKTKQKRKIV